MDCPLIEHGLLAYALGVADDEERARIDEHLLGCASCLKVYLGCKRQVESGTELLPSAAAKKRLRDEVGIARIADDAEIAGAAGAGRVGVAIARAVASGKLRVSRQGPDTEAVELAVRRRGTGIAQRGACLERQADFAPVRHRLLAKR